MTTDQILLFGLFAAVLGLLLWGKVRHDLVAAAGLLCGVLIGVVPQDQAFSGFSNPAVIVVALVLIASRAFEGSGVLALLMRLVPGENRSASFHISVVGGFGAALSAIINNVAALAMLMPLDVQSARKAGRPPGVTLMPLAFATILGGMVTLIGTPPNIIASSIRQKQLGEPYGMFDFTPVGGAVAIAGVLFVALLGWRLVPRREDKTAAIPPASFEVDLLVPESSRLVGTVVVELEEKAEAADVRIVGLIRGRQRLPGFVRAMIIAPGDHLVIEGSTGALAAFMNAVELQPVEDADQADTDPQTDATAGHQSAGRTDPAHRTDGKTGRKVPAKASEKTSEKAERESSIVEVVVRSDSPLSGRTAAQFNLRRRFGITLLGLARAGQFSRDKISDRRIAAGDELLLTGAHASSPAILDRLGLIALNRIAVATYSPATIVLTIGLFAAAILAATVGWLSFTIAIAVAVVCYAALGLVPAREFYSQIEWPIIVMLACLLPLGAAFENVGGTALIANWISTLTQGQSPVVALVAIMVVTMALSDVLNNVATIVIAGPVAIDLAQRLGVNPDTFLMGVAIAASCAFLTPIGHKNNTLIMGPGGFRFSDYWQMGLPLEIVVLVVSVPMLLLVWPL